MSIFIEAGALKFPLGFVSVIYYRNVPKYINMLILFGHIFNICLCAEIFIHLKVDLFAFGTL